MLYLLKIWYYRLLNKIICRKVQLISLWRKAKVYSIYWETSIASPKLVKFQVPDARSLWSLQQHMLLRDHLISLKVIFQWFMFETKWCIFIHRATLSASYWVNRLFNRYISLKSVLWSLGKYKKSIQVNYLVQ